jgi:transposase-like protein
MNKQCRDCRNQKEQIKSGLNRSGTQRLMCRGCGKTSTPEPKGRGYAADVREKAVRMYVEGNNFRRIGRLLNVNHQSVVNWVNAYHEKVKDAAALPLSTATIEIDELWSFVGEKKTERIS